MPDLGALTGAPAASNWSASNWAGNLLAIALFFGLAFGLRLASPWLARHLVRLRYVRGRPQPERIETLRGVVASAIAFAALAGAVVLSLSQFVGADTLLWVIGLFSAAFGLGARDFVNDIVSGLGIIMDDTLAVGDKVAIGGVEGVVEAVNVRMTRLRAPTGELYLVPNGTVRVVRNFTRGRFSAANITVKIATADLPAALAMLEPLGQEAALAEENLIAPWQVINQSGVMGLQTELTLVAKARFGQAAELRPRLLALVHERLSESEIALVD